MKKRLSEAKPSKSYPRNLLDGVIGRPKKLFFDTGVLAALPVFHKLDDDGSVLVIDPGRGEG